MSESTRDHTHICEPHVCNILSSFVELGSWGGLFTQWTRRCCRRACSRLAVAEPCRLVLSAAIEKLLFTHSFTFGHTIYAIISLFCGISVFAFVQSDFGMSVATATSGGVPVNAACRRISPKENASQVSGECIQE
jgi:hypothetical protein